MKRKILLVLIIVLNIVSLNVFAASVNGKYISSKGACVIDFDTGEIIDEYQLVSVKKIFNDEKDPMTFIEIQYEVD